MKIESKTLEEARDALGMKPLAEPFLKATLLPSHLKWFFLAWAFVVLFGVLAQLGFLWLGISSLVISASCFALSYVRVPRTYVSSRHPYRG